MKEENKVQRRLKGCGKARPARSFVLPWAGTMASLSLSLLLARVFSLSVYAASLKKVV